MTNETVFGEGFALFFQCEEYELAEVLPLQVLLYLRDVLNTKEGRAGQKENPETIAVSGFLKFLMRSRLSLGVIALALILSDLV